MMSIKKLFAGALAVSGLLMTMGVAPVCAQESVPQTSEGVTAAADVLAVVTPVVEKSVAVLSAGDTAWMLVSTMLVILMIIPGLALFYGGLARSKNTLSVLMQIFMIFSLIPILWVIYGYSAVFSGGGLFYGTLDKFFLSGITLDSLLGTIPEYVFVAFQSTFAAITVALIVGAFAERMKFAAVMTFAVLWFTFSYLPVAHMVWAAGGLLFEDGALDFAGGTVVHINAGIAGLIGAYLVGKRIGFGREPMPPHSLVLTMIGASLLWVGWFGFNAGSALGANGIAGLAFLNTILAAGAGAVSWIIAEASLKGKSSLLGAASGAVSGLVAVTPAAGFVGPMGAIVLGLLAGPICLWGVSGLKHMLGIDDAFDVFGIHGVGGILGAILTGVFAAPSLGGTGGVDFNMAHQVVVQLKSVIITIIWSGIVSFVLYKLIDTMIGLRVSDEAEREGLDIASHGETAYYS